MTVNKLISRESLPAIFLTYLVTTILLIFYLYRFLGKLYESRIFYVLPIGYNEIIRTSLVITIKYKYYLYKVA